MHSWVSIQKQTNECTTLQEKKGVNSCDQLNSHRNETSDKIQH